MQFVFLTLVVGVVNLCLGYALGMWLSSRLPTPRHGRQGSSETPAACPLALPGLRPHGAADSAGETEAGGAEPELPVLAALLRTVSQSAPQLAELHRRLTRGRAGRDTRSAWNFVVELQGVCEPYMRRLGKLVARFDECDGPGGEPAPNREIQETIVEQIAQLETTLSNLQHMDFDSGFSAAMKRLSAETANMLAVAQKLRAALVTASEGTAV